MPTERPGLGHNPETTYTEKALFGSRLIVHLRELLCLSQERVAIEADISQGYLSQLENGEVGSPSFNTVLRLARSLGTGINLWEKGQRDKMVFLAPQARIINEALQSPIASIPKSLLLTYVETAIPEVEDPSVTYIDHFPTYNIIGEKIAKARTREGYHLTQGQVAKDANISQGYLSQLEGSSKQVENPSNDILSRIASALDVDIHDLLDIKEVEYPETVVRTDRFFRSSDVPPETKIKVWATISSLIEQTDDPILFQPKSETPIPTQ